MFPNIDKALFFGSTHKSWHTQIFFIFLDGRDSQNMLDSKLEVKLCIRAEKESSLIFIDFLTRPLLID